MIGPMENRPSAPDKGLSMSPLARLVPFVFGLIGVTVIVFLWSQPFGEFGSPPLFFRIFGSLIASVFILVGFGGPSSPRPSGGCRERVPQATRRLEGVTSVPTAAPHWRGAQTCPRAGT